MSELVREALRFYKREREGLRGLLGYGTAKGRARGLKRDEDVVRTVREVRPNRRRLKTGSR